MDKREHDIRKWYANPSVTRDGQITNNIAMMVLQIFWDKGSKEVSLDYVATIRVKEPTELLRIMFNQLEELDLITKTGRDKYRYNLNCRNYELQAEVEKQLLFPNSATIDHHPGVGYE